MLEAYRAYFRGIATTYQQLDAHDEAQLNALRLAARLARSNVEASAARISAEPGITAERLSLVNAMLASSHRLILAVMALDSGLAESEHAPARPAFRQFADDVDLTFYYLAAGAPGGRQNQEPPPRFERRSSAPPRIGRSSARALCAGQYRNRSSDQQARTH